MPLPAQLDRAIVAGGALAGLVAGPYLIAVIVLAILGRLSGAEVVFWLISGVVVAGALGAVLAKNVVHAALSLVMAALGVAGIFLLLGSEFLALVQVIVYGGGVAILLMFGLMLTNATDDPVVIDGSQKPFAFGVGLALMGILGVAMAGTHWPDVAPNVIAFKDVGVRLYRDFGVPFEVASLVLIVALVGAVARSEEHTSE